MGLSNTATPKYYAEFRDAVVRGEIPVSREVAMEMERIDENIANPNFYYDEDAVEGFILFSENEMTLTDGSDLSMLPTFKLWAESIFAWWYFTERDVYDEELDAWVPKIIKKRLINIQYLIVARGAAKSLYESLLQAYFLTVDVSTTHQITTAPTMKQAEEIMGPIRTAISRSRGPFFKFLTEGSLQNTTGARFLRQKLVSTKVGIQNFLTNSLLEVRPMAIHKLQGLRTKCNTVDEWLSGDLKENVITAIAQGADKIHDWLIVAVSSEGVVRNGAGDTIKMELQRILRGEYYNPHVSIWHYKLDDPSEVPYPQTWRKAQPNIGKTISYETYHLDVDRMENNPADRNDTLAKRFGIPMEGYTWFFAYKDTIPHTRNPKAFFGMPCAVGADLSQGDDFCAFTLLFPLPYEQFGVKTRSYITRRTLDRLQAAQRLKYEEFIREGTLHIMEGSVLDIKDVYDDLIKWMDSMKYDARAMGYDPYNSQEFVPKWEQDFGPFYVEKVIQGARTESVPLGELGVLASERLLIFDESIMQWTMGNAITKEDTNGNRMLVKQRNEEKVDNVSALMDAYVAFKAHKEAFA